MNVLQVSMPWQALGFPSLPLGLLHAVIRRSLPHVEVSELYANLRWADRLALRGIPIARYDELSNTVFRGIGDFIFSAALHRKDSWRLDEFMMASKVDESERSLLEELQPEAHRFIEDLAQEIAATDVDIVGFSSTFMQNVPSLALAAAIKRRRPEIQTVFGGANMDGLQGVAIHRNFACVDFVVRGEGELAIVGLLRALDGRRDELPTVGSLVWRNAAGETITNADGEQVSMSDVPTPNFDSFFDQLESSLVAPVIRPMLVLEAARGCWWGEKHHCKFCGLNQTGMKFRSKHPDAVWNDISTLVERHRQLDVILVDNILDMRYLDTLLPRIRESGWDLRLHYEIKSNMRGEQLRQLRESRITHVQPGIENLSGRVLKIMDKGVSGVQNVALLREAESEGVTVSWSYLFGFPGEADDDYTSIIEQMPALIHLQPPSGAVRIVVERFSPYFDRPELGFTEKQPAPFYEITYDLPRAELENMVFLFTTEPTGVTAAVEDRLARTIHAWRGDHQDSTLYRYDDGDATVVVDRRVGWPQTEYRIDDSTERRLFTLLDTPQTPESLRRRLEDEGLAADSSWITCILERFARLGFVFRDDGRFVALPNRYDAANIRLWNVLDIYTLREIPA